MTAGEPESSAIQPQIDDAEEPQPEVKSQRLWLRATPRQKRLLQRAADFVGLSLSDFVIGSALDKAVDTIRSNEVIKLSERDARILFEAMENPPELPEKLNQAMCEYSEKVERRVLRPEP